MAKVTSSATRSKRSTKKPVTQGQNPQRRNRQNVSNAKVTDSGGRGSNAGSAKVTTGSGGKPSGNFRAPSIPTRKSQPQASPNQGLSIRGAGRLGAAAAGIQAYNTGDGTLKAAQKRGDYKPKQGPANPDEGRTQAQSFDKAFGEARKSGKKTFDWNNKKYTTETK